MNNVAKFRECLSNAKHVLVLTGSGISAESGIPTFRGPGGFWRTYHAQSLATPQAFRANPSLVWEFYEYRRQLVSKVTPNKAHEAISKFQEKYRKDGRIVSVVTQNIDGLHQKCGTDDVIELHGSLYKTRCTKCKNIEFNDAIPICPALSGKCSPDPKATSSNIPVEELPRCKKEGCAGLLRPDIVWFGENLLQSVLDKANPNDLTDSGLYDVKVKCIMDVLLDEAVEACDACLIIGTSSDVYPAAMFAPTVAARGVPVAELNLEVTSATRHFQYHFCGPCTKTVPLLLDP